MFDVEQNKNQIAKVLKAYQIIKKFLPEQSLAYSTSRSTVQDYAKKMYEWLERDNVTATQEMVQYSNRKLTDLSTKGVDFYHAGLSEGDKQKIVTNYSSGIIKVLVATSSLAWGVNLPAMAVIIMDTDYANPLTGKEPMSSADILQMLGRAGRPQYHAKGYGYVLTNGTYRSVLENMLEGNAPIVSSMHEYLDELVLHYLALVKAQEIPINEVMNFFEQSFMVQSGNMQQEAIEEELEKSIIRSKIAGLIGYEHEKLSIRPSGTLTSRFFIHPRTAGNLLAIRPKDDPEEMIPLLVEFNNIPVRRTEKKFLRSLGATPKNYQQYKLQYVIGAMERKEHLEPEFISDGTVLYKEYIRIQSFYNYLKKINRGSS